MSPLEKKELEYLHGQSEKFMQEENENSYLDTNSQFHALICAGAHNKYLATLVTDLRSRLAPFRQAQSRTSDRLTVSHHERNDVVAAILAGNCEVAYNAMRDHNARLSTSVIRLIKSRQEVE